MQGETRRPGTIYNRWDTRRSGWEFINTCKSLMGRIERDGERLVLVVPSERTKRSGHELKYKKFHINIYIKKTLPWIWSYPGTDCPGKLRHFQPWDFLKSSHSPEQPALVDPCEPVELGYISSGPLPAQYLCDYVLYREVVEGTDVLITISGT